MDPKEQKLEPAALDFTKARRMVASGALASIFFALGLCLVLPGPLMIEFKNMTHSSISSVSWVLVARAFGYLLGAVLAGFAMRRRLFGSSLGFATITFALSTIITPWCTRITALIAAYGIGGLSMGIIETAGHALCIAIWGNEYGSSLQLMYTMYVIGQAVAPLYVGPFVLSSREKLYESIDIDPIVIEEPNRNSSFGPSDDIVAVNEDIVGYLTNNFPITKLHLMFIFLTVYIISAGLALLISYRFVWSILSESETPKESKTTHLNKSIAIGMVVMMAIFACLTVGVEINYGSFILTYMVYGLERSVDDGITVTTLFFVGVCGSSIVGSFLGKFIHYNYLLTFNICILCTTSIVMALFPSNFKMVFFMTIVLGIGYGNIFPAAVFWTKLNVGTSGAASAALIGGSMLGQGLFPLVTGKLLMLNPAGLIYLLPSTSLMAGGIFLSAVLLARSQTNGSASEYEPIIHDTDQENGKLD